MIQILQLILILSVIQLDLPTIEIKYNQRLLLLLYGMSASISIQAETATKIDSLISPFIMVDYLIKF